MDDDILDLVDEHYVVQGQMPREEIRAKGLRNFRVINAFLKNSQGELWIPIRTAHKKMFPNCLDVSVGGHVSAGEDYDVSFVREMEEEIRFKAEEVNWRRIARLTPHEHNVSAFMWVYEILTDETPNYNPDDFSSARWIAPLALLEELKAGALQKGDLLKLVTHCYGEVGGSKSLEPTRYGDWEHRGRCSDF